MHVYVVVKTDFLYNLPTTQDIPCVFEVREQAESYVREKQILEADKLDPSRYEIIPAPLADATFGIYTENEDEIRTFLRSASPTSEQKVLLFETVAHAEEYLLTLARAMGVNFHPLRAMYKIGYHYE